MGIIDMLRQMSEDLSNAIDTLTLIHDIFDEDSEEFEMLSKVIATLDHWNTTLEEE